MRRPGRDATLAAGIWQARHRPEIMPVQAHVRAEGGVAGLGVEGAVVEHEGRGRGVLELDDLALRGALSDQRRRREGPRLALTSQAPPRVRA